MTNTATAVPAKPIEGKAKRHRSPNGTRRNYYNLGIHADEEMVQALKAQARGGESPAQVAKRIVLREIRKENDHE